MNIHPALVHFPIALLISYALLELLPLARYFPAIAWRGIRSFLLYAGTLAAFPTALAGLIAEDLAGETNAIIPYHKTAAICVLVIFSLASLLALRNHYRPWGNQVLYSAKQKILALLGLIALLITGALGGAIVYGTGSDPFVAFIAGLFGLK